MWFICIPEISLRLWSARSSRTEKLWGDVSHTVAPVTVSPHSSQSDVHRGGELYDYALKNEKSKNNYWHLSFFLENNCY